MIDALLLFGQQEHFGVGIDYVDAAAFQQRVTIQLRASTVADVLNAITRRFGYRWSVNGRVVRIRLQSDIDQCKAVIAEDTSVAVDAVGDIPKRHAVHLALFAIKTIDVSRCEKGRRTVTVNSRR
jgi:hypothetical protein